jgi:DNA-directed RNA polymerase subunit M/transcription elongation factor TFIIS
VGDRDRNPLWVALLLDPQGQWEPPTPASGEQGESEAQRRLQLGCQLLCFSVDRQPLFRQHVFVSCRHKKNNVAQLVIFGKLTGNFACEITMNKQHDRSFFLRSEQKQAQQMLRVASATLEVEKLLLGCEAFLYQQAARCQRTEVYRAGIQDLLAKADFFDLARVESKVDPEWFVASDPREMERKWAKYIRHDRSFTASLCVKHPSEKAPAEETVADLVSTENLLTEEMAKALLSVPQTEGFYCSKCKKYTGGFKGQQTRAGDEAMTEFRYCSTCK